MNYTSKRMEEMKRNGGSSSRTSEKRESITKGKKKKVPLGERIKKVGKDNASDIGSYVLNDILLPSIKNILADTVESSVNLLLFKDAKKRSNINRRGSSSYVSYASSSSNRSNINNTARSSHDFSDYVVDNKGDAEEVLSTMVDILEASGSVTVGDFYELIDVPSVHTDNKYGWTNLSSACIKRGRDGYYFDLPRTKQL